MEPLLDPANNRLTIYPIKFEDIWRKYKEMQAANWTAEEIDFSQDVSHYEKLNKDEKSKEIYFEKRKTGNGRPTKKHRRQTSRLKENFFS